MLKPQQKFRTEKQHGFIEKVKKIALLANEDKRIQSIDSIETYAYGTSKILVYKKRLNVTI